MNNPIANESQFSLRLKEANTIFAVDAVTVANESLSQSYEIKTWIRTSTPLLLSTIHNQSVLLTLFGKTNNSFLHGIVKNIKTLGRTPDGKQFAYFLVIESPLFPLKQKQTNRIFLNQSVTEVITTIFQTAGWSIQRINLQTTKHYPKRECIIQSNESDYDFLLRLISFWGLFFSWVQQEDSYQLIITDTIDQFDNLFSPETLPYYNLSGTTRPAISIFYLETDVRALAQSVIIRDYNPKQPNVTLKAQTQPQANRSVPGIGIEDRYGEHVTSQEEAEFIATVRQQALDWQRQTFTFYSDCPNLQLGQRLTLNHCSREHYNRDYHIIAIEHRGDQQAAGIYPQELAINQKENPPFSQSLTYYNKLLCIAADIPYATYFPIKGKKYHGLLTAKIESAEDDTSVYLDEFGNYRVRFPFDQSDAPKGQASPPLRLSQPYAGENYGFHFPLRAGTQVLLSFENGDIDRPIIMGVLPHATQPTPVTSQNATQNIIRTPSGHTLLMEDLENQSRTELSTRNQQHQLVLDGTDNNHQIKLATQQGKMQLQAKQTFTTQTQGDYQQIIGKDHYVTVENDHQVTTQQGDIQLQANRDLKIKAKNNIQQNAQQHISLQSGKNMVIQTGQGATIRSNEGDILITTPKGNFNIKAAQGITLAGSGKKDITIAQSGAMVKVKADGSILFQAKKINIYAKQHNLVGTEAHLGGQGKAAPSPTPQMPTEVRLIFSYAEGLEKKPIAATEYEATRADTFPCPHSQCDAQGQSILNNLDQGEKITLTNTEISIKNEIEQWLPIIEINQQKCSPWEKLELNVPNSPNQGETPDAAHTFHLTAIRTPNLIDYTAYVSKKSKDIPLLTTEQINYFKNNGNNATLFVHGFQVDPGSFPLRINNVISSKVTTDKAVESIALTTNRNNACSTICCTLDDLRIQFPCIPNENSIFDIDNETDFDIPLNGADSAHNWFLHMEYNLNCAASGKYPFDWKTHGLDYTRIINIIWPGNVPKMLFLNAEEPAYETGMALIPLLQQLYQAGIEINIIAHSLGSRVVLTAMQNLKIPNIIENVFLWQSAVPDNALLPILPYSPDDNIFPQAYLAAKKIIVLYSEQDKVLSDAYRLAMGEQVEGFPKNIQQLIELGSVALQKHRALGSVGPDPITRAKLGSKIYRFDQKDLLDGHGGMRIPSKPLFEGIYKKLIISSEKGIKNFGKWKIT